VINLIHISDLHFCNISKNPFQIFSKRFLGTVNHLINRRYAHDPKICYEFIDKLESSDVVLISGDFTTTSFTKEFSESIKFLKTLVDKGIKVLAIPGNHDQYTKATYKRGDFYRYLGPYIPMKSDDGLPFHLEKDGLAAIHLANDTYMVLLDTAIYSSYIQSTGEFSKNLEKNLIDLLSMLKGKRILMANHYPLFLSKSPRHSLKRREALQRILELHTNVEMYLHGHTHVLSLADLRESNLPIVIDAGSLSYTKRSSYNHIQISESSYVVKSYLKNILHKEYTL